VDVPYSTKQCGQILPGLHIGVPRTFPVKISPTGGMSQDSGPISLVQKWHLARAWGARQSEPAHHPLQTHYGSLVEEPQELICGFTLVTHSLGSRSYIQVHW